MILSFSELIHDVLNSKIGQDGAAGCTFHSFIFVSESQDKCSEILRAQSSETFDALDFGEGLSFGHAFDEDELCLWAEAHDSFGCDAAYPGRGVIEEAVIEGQEIFGLEVGDALASPCLHPASQGI
jgi:hypothetical protein